MASLAILKTMWSIYANKLARQNRALLHSFFVLTASLGVFLAYSWLMLHTIHQIDKQVYYSIYTDVLYYHYAIDLPFLAGIMVVLATIAWLCVRVFRSKCSAAYLLMIGFYLLEFLMFFIFLGFLDFGNFL